jgi:hypothetical protein
VRGALSRRGGGLGDIADRHQNMALGLASGRRGGGDGQRGVWEEEAKEDWAMSVPAGGRRTQRWGSMDVAFRLTPCG